MLLSTSFFGLLFLAHRAFSQSQWGIQQSALDSAICPDYRDYSSIRHPPLSKGDTPMPFQRPAEECRLFRSESVEKLIEDMKAKLADPDLARLFENAYPNTLDTTVRWHVGGKRWGPAEYQTFVVTGDINAQWLRDSTNQLSQYQQFAKSDSKIRDLILGAINTQADFVTKSPYCNAFQPPRESGLKPTNNGQSDTVNPVYDNTVVFECKYEVDSLAAFLSLGNQYFENTGDASFVNNKWLEALKQLLIVLDEQAVSTFSWEGYQQNQVYKFSRWTNVGTETLNLGGIGNPINANTSLIRSAFRPSDDATIFPFFIPGNAYLAVELGRTAEVLKKGKLSDIANDLARRSKEITDGIWKHGVYEHPKFGRVFAYETDGYGSHLFMDDANLPSLLSLPLLGFVGKEDKVYQNTRKMILSLEGNPYYIKGLYFEGIGGPHVGIRHAWPMSVLVQIMTSDDDEEIKRLLEMVKANSPLGLINESVNVNRQGDYTRSWFAWANSVFAEAVLDLAKRKPHLVFGSKKAGGSG